MASILEKLGIETRGLEDTITPFQSWIESSIRDWKVTLRMLTIGELAELAERISHASSSVEMTYLSKIHLLATALIDINNVPIVSEEEVEKYNKDHNLSGSQSISSYNYKVLLIKKLSELVINTLVVEYDKMQERYMRAHLGKIPSDEIFNLRTDLSKVMNNVSPDNPPGLSEESDNRGEIT
jgi:hypothetical protein